MTNYCEPWKFEMPAGSNGYINISNVEGRHVATSYADTAQEFSRRLVACVNACAGVATETLETSPDLASAFLSAENAKLIQQRDELLAALILLEKAIPLETAKTKKQIDAWNVAYAAIEKAEANHG